MSNDKLDEYDFSSYKGFNAQLIKWRYEVLQDFFKGESCLELGSSDGQGTEYLIDKFKYVTAVDGSESAIKNVQNKFGDKIEAVCSFFEDLKLDKKYDTIVMAHILEHVNNPLEVLTVAMNHLAEDGVLIIDVPNGMSLHRQVGVELKMLKEVTELNDADKSIGHQRVYTPETFKADIVKAGFNVKEFGGFLIKTVSNSQMEKNNTPELNKALFDLGRAYPEISAEMYVVAKK